MAPILTSLNPATGPAAGFNPVTITAAAGGFANVGPLSVRFGTTATTFTIDSDTQITAIAPPGTGTVPVTVQVLLDGVSTSLNYTYVGGPGPSGGVIYIADGLATVYSMTTTAPVVVTPVVTGLATPTDVALSADGKTLYIATALGAVFAWTVGAGPTTATLLGATGTGGFGLTV